MPETAYCWVLKSHDAHEWTYTGTTEPVYRCPGDRSGVEF